MEIGPQSCAKESYVAYDQLALVEQVNVASAQTSLGELLFQRIHLLSIGLAVPVDIDDRNLGKGLISPTRLRDYICQFRRPV